MTKAYLESLKELHFPIDFPGHFVAGSFAACERGALVKEVINPSSGQVLTTVRLDRGLLDKAMEAAAQFEGPYGRSSIKERFEILKKFRHALGDFQAESVLAMQLEGGKPKWEAMAEFEAALKFVDDMLAKEETLFSELIAPLAPSSSATSISLKALGTTFAHIPFTMPCTSFVKFFTVSVVSGAPLMVMASAHATLFTTLMAHMIESLSLPKGLISIFCGSFEMFRMGCQDRRVKAVIYRGSREHSRTIKQESFEIPRRQAIVRSGGKNAALIHPSASMEDAVRLVLYGAFKSAGQLCASTSRVFVPTAKLPDFTDLVVKSLRELDIGPTDEPGANPAMGPLYSKKARDKFLRFQTMAKRESQRTVQWGKTLDLGKGGFFVTPGVHILSDLNPKSAYQSNVLLFPDIAVYEYDDIQKAVDGMNNMDAPLVASVITQDLDVVDSFTFKAPNVLVNLPTVETEDLLPVAGRDPCGSVRHNGTGLVESLTYPVAKVALADAAKAQLGWERDEEA